VRANSAGQQATGFQDRRGPKGVTFKGLRAERSGRCNGIKCCRGLRTSISSQRTAAKKPRDMVALLPREESLRVKGPSHSNALTSGLGWINRAIMFDTLTTDAIQKVIYFDVGDGTQHRYFTPVTTSRRLRGWTARQDHILIVERVGILVGDVLVKSPANMASSRLGCRASGFGCLPRLFTECDRS